MTSDMLLAIVAGLALGALAVWLLRGREVIAVKAERDSERAALAAARDALVGAQRDHALARQTADERLRETDALRADIARLTARIETLDADRVALAELKSTLAEREANHLKRERELEDRFAALAAEALGKSHEEFVRRAEETLKLHREAASQDLGKNRAALGELLGPVRETLTKYETQLKEIEEKRATAYGAITGAIADVKLGQERVAQEAQRIVGALRNAPKARGRWGEHQLKRVLEMAGLSPHCDFAEEVSVEGEDGRLRPDVVVNLPGDRVLVIDAKCSLNSYDDAYNAETDEERRVHLLAHAKALRTHVDQLGRKAYAQQFDDTLDFVIMFVPGENFLAAALEADYDLFEFAFGRKVLLASPTNLIAIARTVAMVWRQEKLTADFTQIADLGRELHDRIATMGEHVVKLGKNLGTAMNAYNAMVGSLESQVMTQAERFTRLAIDPPKKTLEELPVLTTEPRMLTKLASAAE